MFFDDVFAILVCVDAPSTDQTFNAMQAMCMFNFYNSDILRERFSRRNPSSPVCGTAAQQPWEGVQCADGIAESVWYGHMHYTVFRIEHLPSTIKHISMPGNDIKGEIDTRLLPRALDRLFLQLNSFFGKFDVATLPAATRVIVIHDNKIVSIGSLLNFPAKLSVLNVSNNSIKEKRLFFGTIPRQTRCIDIRGNAIGRVLPFPHVSHIENRYSCILSDEGTKVPSHDATR